MPHIRDTATQRSSADTVVHRLLIGFASSAEFDQLSTHLDGRPDTQATLHDMRANLGGSHPPFVAILEFEEAEATWRRHPGIAFLMRRLEADTGLASDFLEVTAQPDLGRYRAQAPEPLALPETEFEAVTHASYYDAPRVADLTPPRVLTPYRAPLFEVHLAGASHAATVQGAVTRVALQAPPPAWNGSAAQGPRCGQGVIPAHPAGAAPAQAVM